MKCNKENCIFNHCDAPDCDAHSAWLFKGLHLCLGHKMDLDREGRVALGGGGYLVIKQEAMDPDLSAV